MSAKMGRTTPSGNGSFTISWDHDGEPKAEGRNIRLIHWKEHTGTIEAYVPVDDVPAYAAALLAEYVKIKERQAVAEARLNDTLASVFGEKAES